MARPFDESLPYQHIGSSMSSQTSLAGDRAWKTSADGSYPSSLAYDVGQSMNPPRLMKNPSKRSQKPKLPKIKSSPSHGALAAARANHAKLHRQGNSASTQSPTSPTFLPDYLMQTASPVVPASAHANLYSTPETKERKSSKVKTKPLLRKFTSREQVSIDLSRSAAENEGLGIYTSSEISGAPDSGSGRRGGYHNRTTSATSQLSSTTTSSNPRYGAQYVHPMRQTPRSYTPPIASSYKTSLESDAPTANTSINTSVEAPYFESNSRSASHTAGAPYAPLPSSRRPTPLHIRTGSAARLTSSSQTNLPGTPSSLRFNTDSITPSDMVGPAGRSSLESAFRMRSRSNPADVDPAAQKAIVDIKRQEFNEREAAKDLKYQQAEARAQEKEARRQERKEEEERRTSEKRERKRARSNAASEKSSFLISGEPHESFPSVQTLPQEFPVAAQPMGRKRGDTAESAGKAGKAVHSQWTLFWFRFKTVWLRLKRKMSKSSN
ncbi:hypothetical protein HO133_009430 [Letharia lupina]|uniref:Uncharacterized protein n=1 Tax=Letharia lupina TaxID=560253 RepID=A0A8H6FG34_9LECA|nr:uncharacterized protein HO133_009430 [Letharia lupina]KAF6226564.1 hypothetical protein HO133_009430 [Letharia lupina]